METQHEDNVQRDAFYEEFMVKLVSNCLGFSWREPGMSNYQRVFILILR